MGGPTLRVGFIGCGSHSFRNVYPVLRFVPVELAAVCDLDSAKAAAFARQFGASASYTDYRTMLAQERLDAVFIVTGYDAKGRPLYPALARDCLEAGCHVWMEKPPAASVADLDALREVADRAGRTVMVGFKKMFFPANEKAHKLSRAPDFGRLSLVTMQYPQSIPTPEEFARYRDGECLWSVVGFLDHLCHPVSLMLLLAGMPERMRYARAADGGGVAVFSYPSGAVTSMALLPSNAGHWMNGGMERTLLASDKGRGITIENNFRVTYHRRPPDIGYGDAPDFYHGSPDEANAVWEPEFSLGQLYNKGLFLLGYYGEIREFVHAILENRPPAKATLADARDATRIFERFAEGPDREITL